MLNISLGGCFLEIEASSQSVQQEAQIQVTMTVEGGKVVPLNAVIKRVIRAPEEPKKYRLGVEFGKLNSFEESRVNEVVMKCYRLANRFGTRLKDN